MKRVVFISTLRYISIVLGNSILGGVLQSLSYKLVLPFSVLCAAIGCWLVFKPNKLGRSISIPFFVSSALQGLLALAIYLRSKGVAFPDQVDYLFFIFIFAGYAIYIAVATREARKSAR